MHMLFADYLDQWLEIVRARIKPATFGSYQGMVKSTIGPYFRKKELTLKELEGVGTSNSFIRRSSKTVTPNSVIHYHAVIYQALKYAMKTDMVPQNVAMKVDKAEEELVSADLPWRGANAEAVRGCQGNAAGASGFGCCVLWTAPWRGARAKVGCDRFQSRNADHQTNSH